MFIATVVMSQDKEHKNHLWKYEGKNKMNTIGMYGGLYGSYSPVSDNSAGYLGYRLGIVFNQRYVIGLAGFGLSYDKTLNAITEEGSYHLQAGYAGLYFEYIYPVSKNLKMSASLISATGLALYKYDKEFRDGKEWYEETLDRDNFHVFEPGVEIQIRMASNWWLGAYATYRFTSPIDMKDTDEDILQNYSAGLSLKFGIF